MENATQEQPRTGRPSKYDDRFIESVTEYLDLCRNEYIRTRSRIATVMDPGAHTDALYGNAKRLVIEQQRASTSYLQRSLAIGYSRAAALMETLEERGVIGPDRSLASRDVLMTKEDPAYDEIDLDDTEDLPVMGTKEWFTDPRFKVSLPTVEGFAVFIGVHKDTLYEWAKDHDIFSDALDAILDVQKQRLLDNGLSGHYNSTIAKLILASNHGMHDKVDTDLTSKGQQVAGVGVILDKAYGNGESADTKPGASA